MPADPAAPQRNSRRRRPPARGRGSHGLMAAPGAGGAGRGGSGGEGRPPASNDGGGSPAPKGRRGRKTLSPLLLKAFLAVAFACLLGLGTLLAVHITDPQRLTESTVEAPIVDPPQGHARLQPTVFHAQDQLELFDPIAQRGSDDEALTDEELFADQEELSFEDLDLELRESRTTDTCTGEVWGDTLAETLAEAECASASHALYVDSDDEYVAQVTMFDLADVSGAESVVAELAPDSTPAFIVPMDSDYEGLHEGHSQATAQVMGHYLGVFWVARADGEPPEDDDSLASVNVAVMDAALEIYRRVNGANGDGE
ncbi:hypothetical protein J4H86_04635 [Spiractinospora alimapuensis]|uniref:hypothetical protein n=1 Tax=Spiractinospora alimapuensis TaxID=2820884 RepID=UPI001F319A48|nr:hypothetical protein [Spiractinospora alimapuensis]QVQ53086.1 hypothetical protein J4H86_04635 [Spiractinospora alimapuensis]